MTEHVLELLDSWLQKRRPTLEGKGLQVSITWGPSDRDPAGAWVDFESTKRSARLTVWANGLADLSVGDYVTNEILVDEHREITSEIGLEEVESTVLAWLTGDSERP